MKKIESLTKEQEDYLPIFRDEWLKIGLSTEAVDQKLSTGAVKQLYSAGGMEEPIVMHFQSPWQCIMVINFLQKFGDLPKNNLRANLRGNLGDNLWENLWESIGDNLWESLRDNLGENLGDNLWESIEDNLWESLWENLRGNLGDNLWESIRESLRDNLGDNLEANLGNNLGANLRGNLRGNLRDNLWESLRDNLGGNLWENLRDNLKESLKDNLEYIQTWFWAGQDASWLAFYEFGEKIGVKYQKTDHFHAYIDFAKSSGWGYFYPGIAIVSDRPELIIKDLENRLHCEDGPALKFRDGYSIYCWHGINVPENWILEKDKLSPTEVLKTIDVEQRAAGCQIIGWAKMLDHLDHKIIDSDMDPEHGDLIKITLEGLPEPEWYLRFYCPRNGLMMEGVSKRELKEPTVFAAQAWKSPLPDHLFTYPEHRS